MDIRRTRVEVAAQVLAVGPIKTVVLVDTDQSLRLRQALVFLGRYGSLESWYGACTARSVAASAVTTSAPASTTTPSIATTTRVATASRVATTAGIATTARLATAARITIAYAV